VESEKTNRISQQVESDATPPSPDISISFEITPEVTQDGDHVADEDADDDEDQGPVMGCPRFYCSWKNSEKFM